MLSKVGLIAVGTGALIAGIHGIFKWKRSKEIDLRLESEISVNEEISIISERTSNIVAPPVDNSGFFRILDLQVKAKNEYESIPNSVNKVVEATSTARQLHEEHVNQSASSSIIFEVKDNDGALSATVIVGQSGIKIASVHSSEPETSASSDCDPCDITNQGEMIKKHKSPRKRARDRQRKLEWKKKKKMLSSVNNQTKTIINQPVKQEMSNYKPITNQELVKRPESEVRDNRRYRSYQESRKEKMLLKNSSVFVDE